MGFNSVTIVGNLGADPELKEVGDSVVCNFSVATSKKVKGEEVTQWHRMTAWGKTAEIISKYARKGHQHLFVGEIEYRPYTDKNGVDKISTEIRVNNVQLLRNDTKGTEDDVPF